MKRKLGALGVATWFAVQGAAGCTPSQASQNVPGQNHIDAGRHSVDAGAAEAGCKGIVVGAPVTLTDANARAMSTFVFSGDGAIGVGRGPGGTGYRALEVDASGQPRGPAQTLWPAAPSSDGPHIAVASDVLAIVDQTPTGTNQRPICSLGLVHLPDLTSIMEPTRVSDAPDDASVLNEASACNVAQAGSEIVVFWRQVTSKTSLAASLFAQRFSLAGAPLGKRLVLASGSDLAKLSEVAVTSTGPAAVVAYAAGTGTRFSFVEAGAVRTVPVALDDVLHLAFAHGGLLVQTGQSAALLDADGTVTYGPVALPTSNSGWLVAPLGPAWVGVSHQEFLVARGLDGHFAASSPEAGLSDDRGASASQLVYASDGSWTVALYYDGAGATRLTRFMCSAEPSQPPGPSACPVQASIEPLDDGCADPVCHLAIRLDYRTLGLRGYASIGGPSSPVDATGAAGAARVVFDANGQYLSPQIEVEAAQAGVFRATVAPADFGAVALVGAGSGVVITAGGVVWTGRGSYWSPSTWQDGSAVICGTTATAPSETFLDSASCVGFDGMSSLWSASDALDLVLHTNLAQHYAAQGPFSAYVQLYTPTVGGCSPGSRSTSWC